MRNIQSELKQTVFGILEGYAIDCGVLFKPTIKSLKELNRFRPYTKDVLTFKAGNFACEVPHEYISSVAESIIKMEKYEANPNIANPIKVDIKAQLEKQFEQTKQARKKLGYKY